MKEPVDILKVFDLKGYTQLHGYRWPLWIPLKDLRREAVKRICLEKAHSSNPDDIEVKKALCHFLFPTLKDDQNTAQEESTATEMDRAGTGNSEIRSVARVLPNPRTAPASKMEDIFDNTDDSEDPNYQPPDPDSTDEVDSTEEHEVSDSVTHRIDDDSDDPDYQPPDPDSTDEADSTEEHEVLDSVTHRIDDDSEADPNQYDLPSGSADGEAVVSDSDADSDGDEHIPDIEEHFPGLVPLQAGSAQSREMVAPAEVAHTSNSEKRVWDRKNVCYYCGKMQSKIARHLQRCHSTEHAVKSAMAHEKNSKERREAFLSIRQRGNYAYNIQIRCGDREGPIIPSRRQNHSGKYKAHDFLVCDMCSGFFFRKTLWRHRRSCTKKRGGRAIGGRVQNKALAQMPTPKNTPQGYQEVLDKMNMDDVSLICRTDNLITQFGIRLYEKVGKDQHQHISAKIRELGRVVKELQRTDKNATLVSYLVPSKFEAVTSAVRSIAGYNTDTNKYGIASLALKLGHSLKKCAVVEKANCIQAGRDASDVDGFLQLMDLEWTDKVSRRAHKTLQEDKWNRPDLLPLTEDLKILQEHLSEKLRSGSEKLRQYPSAVNHKDLAEVVLARMILFNRKRQGEAGKLTKESFGKAERVNLQDDVEDTLSEVEKRLAKSLSRVVIKGKKGRGVPMLLTMEMTTAIELLVETREAAGLPASEYLFTNTCGTAMRGCDALKKFAQSCGARHPEAITSTSLRKHVATMSQLLDLRENELDQLANFLGHDVAVHRNFYRLPSACTQVTQISKILIAAENSVQMHRGARLEDIDVDFPPGESQHTTARNRQLDDESEQDEEKQATGPFQEKVFPGESHHTTAGTRQLDDEESEKDEKQATGSFQEKAAKEMDERVNKYSGTRKYPRRESSGDEDCGETKKRRKRQPWTAREKAAVREQLADLIKKGEVPGKAQCTLAIQAAPSLHQRDWRSVKYCAYNMIQAQKRMFST